MTIIDQYISDNYQTKAANQISVELGLNYKYVLSRIRNLRRNKSFPGKSAISRSNEVVALNALISERGSGWAVEVAKERIRKLEYFGNDR